MAEEQTVSGVMLSALERIQENVNANARSAQGDACQSKNLNENANDNARSAQGDACQSKNLNNDNLNPNPNLNLGSNANVKGGRGILPSKMLLLQWIGSCQMIEAETKRLEEAAETTVRYFRENGFACQILKGCAVGRYYPEPLRRSSGDIDIWLDGGRKRIYDFARAFDKEGKLYGVNYHHIHFHLIEDVHIEVHIWPSYLSSPLRNWRLHKFCKLHRPTMEATMPSLAFDRVFIMLHAFQHLCGHGVGLRQVMDYFYVLRQGFTEEERKDAVYWIRQLGMGRFARGLMWVLREYFGLEERYMLMEPDEREGRFIMHEVMLTGNMGHSDKRNWGSMRTPLSRFFLNLKRDFYLVGHYPHEAVWQPVFSIWLYAWRLWKGLI